MSTQAPHDVQTIAAVLGPAGQAALVRLAWQAVRAAAAGRPLDPALVAEAPQTPLFGAFVTLSAGERLRGCIGAIGRVAPAAQLVADAGRSSAVGDPRFPPVTADEIAGLSLEVSLLTPLEWLDPDSLPGAVRVGEHGLVVEKLPYRGLLLPQVAVEWGWDEMRLLEETCRKAGLPRDAWRQGARVARFGALVLPGGRGE